MSSILNHPLAQALAWSLVHFIWQGAAIALTACAVMRLGRQSASARYITGVVAMAAMLIAPALTFARLSAVAPIPPAAATPFREAAPLPTTSVRQAPLSPVAPAGPATAPGEGAPPLRSLTPMAILVLWSSGVVVLSLRLLGGWFVARRMARRATSPAAPEIQALARKIAGRLALDRVVGVFESSAVAVPVMIGWMKPVVLLPAAALAGLSIVQVEALLAHEFAHVRRHDYLVNLLQSVVETLLFYHPAVWWVSNGMRVDRELCCDDVALEVCDRIVYATALSDLAAMTMPPRLALAATDGPLLNRVRRILGQPADRQDPGSGWLSALLVVLLVGSIAPSVLTSNADPQSAGETRSAGLEPGVADGVQSGVTDGGQSGVLGGVPVGVVGGVRRGVAPGVVGGVQGPVRSARPAAKEPWVIVPAEEPSQAEQAAAAKARQIEEERHQIELARIDNEFRHTTDQATARVASLEQDLKLERQQVERVKTMMDKGLVDSAALVERQAALAKVERAIVAEKDNLNYKQESFMLKRRELEVEREARAINQDRVAAPKALLAERAAASDRTAVERDRWAGAAMMSPSTDPVRAGDLLGISIANEPDLPHNYVVQADGTIHFPLVGAIRVLGLTGSQVREALSKQLTDRKLAAGSGTIEVALRRPKGR